ncbi:MAG: tetratricopeptide repeat protein [Magnetococcus sp. YQC-5]
MNRASRDAASFVIEQGFESPTTQETNRLIELFNQGDYPEMEALARAMTHRYPRHGFGWKLLGVAIKQQGRVDEALAPMQKAVELLPGDAQIHNNLGVALHEQGRLVEAEASYRRALKIKPDYGDAHSNLGVTLQEQGRLPEAKISFRRALKIHPDDAMTHGSLGNILQEMGRLDEAETSYRLALKIQPDFAEAASNLGTILQEKGQLTEAVSAFRQALKFKPDAVEANIGLGEVLLRLVPMWHVPMINDGIRNEAYLSALRAAITSETRVLEIGTGSGLLAMMAARLGAKQVVTCEAIPIIAAAAQEVVASNGLSSLIGVKAKESKDLQIGVDLPERANLLVTEIFSSELLGEWVLPSILDAKQRLLTPDARIIPAAGSVMFALCGGEELKNNVMVDEACGFDLSRFNQVVSSKFLLHRQDITMDLFTDDTEAFRFDFVRNDSFSLESKIIRMPIRRAGSCFGVIQWLRLQMDDQIYFENHPSSKVVASGWQHCFYRFRTMIDVEPGQVVILRATHNRNQVWFSFEGFE